MGDVLTLPGVTIAEAVAGERRLQRIRKLQVMLRRHARELAMLTGEDVVIAATPSVAPEEGAA